MTTVPATDAKNRFGELLETVHREPVEISKKGRVVAVMLSLKDYENLRRPAGEVPRNEFQGIRAWVDKHKKIKTKKPLDKDDYRKHLLERYGK
jgi:prevent-host-death family protein